MRTANCQRDIAEWFGCGNSCANDDIDDIVCLLYNCPQLKAEISWPTQVQGDAIVSQVADWAPNLAGCIVCGDDKKRATQKRGNSYDKSLHTVDYDGNKGHGRRIFLCCEIPTGRMCYINSNHGGRAEPYCYQEYDICRQHHHRYWLRTLLPANPDHGRPMARWVSWNGVGDAAYNIPLNNLPGAPDWYAPKHHDPHGINAELNRRAEYARAVVEHQFGRIGQLWKVASDDAGPWHHFQGGHGHLVDGGTGSEWGMKKSVIYYTVAARLTAMVQRMRNAYPRDPSKFFENEYEQWELAIALRRIQESQAAM